MPILHPSRLFRPAALLAGLLALPAWAAGPVVLDAAQIRSLGVTTAAASAAADAPLARLPARVAVPNAQLRVVAAPVAGMIDSLLVAPGETVRRGQPVARLASPQALELQRDALQAASQTRLAEQSLKRDEQLFAEGLIAESRLQATRAAAAQAAAQASERRQGLALAGVAPGKVGGPLVLVAPIDGAVLEQGAQVGERVEASALIYRIAQLSPLWLEIQAPAAMAAGLREGRPVRVAGGAAHGKLVAVGRAVDPASQSLLLRARVEAGADTLRPGQAVEVDLDGPAGSAAAAPAGVRLPASAIVRHGAAALVFVQGPGEAGRTAFAPREVKVLRQAGDAALVDGVRPGEIVAVGGVSGLKAVWTGVGKE